ncbi:MAG: EAL domain-containing protein [Pseudomonadota bacterium]
MHEKVRARAIVFWTLFVVPVGMHISGLTSFNAEWSAKTIGGLVGVFGVLGSVVYLRLTKKTIGAGTVFAVSTVFGLALEPLVSGNTKSASLIVLATTPVIFGYMVNWRRCLQSACFLMLYYPAVYLSAILNGPPQTGSLLFLFACTASMIGCSFSTTAFSWATSKSAAKLRRQKKEIEKIARTDALTGIQNRRAFNERLRSLSNIGSDKAATLALFDLDGFKVINDHFGHDVGDSILNTVGVRIGSRIQETSALYRLGGDEFAILCEHRVDVEVANDLVRMLVACFDDPIETAEGAIPVSTSIGTECLSGPSIDPKVLYRNADMALFEAKSHSERRWQAHSAELGDRIERRRELLDRLKSAISKEQMTIVYQPQHNVETGRVIGFEALTRWNDAKFGAVSPDEFILLAEESGLVSDLDKTMMRQALRNAEDWIADDVTLALNVSGATLVSDGFVRFVRALVEQSSLKPAQLQLEITETSLIEKWQTARETVLALSELGVSLALDDFGTGYSSLSYLSAFPIDRLKIDRAFLQGQNLATNVKVMHSIMTLAGSLGLDVLIEGVETKQHLEIVKSLGCSKVQGYLFSAPILSYETIDYLEAFNFPPLRRSA